MADDIKAKIELVDKMSNEFKEVASKVDKSVNSLKTSADKAGNAFKETNNAAKQAGREMSIVGNQGVKGMQQISNAAQGLGSQVRNLGTSVIRGDLGGAVMAVSQVSTQGFKAMGLQAALATGAIGLAVGGISLIASKVSEHFAEIKRKQEELKTNLEKLDDLEIKLMEESYEKIKKINEKKKDEDLKLLKDSAGKELEILAEKYGLLEDGTATLETALQGDVIAKKTEYLTKLEAFKKNELAINRYYDDQIADQYNDLEDRKLERQNRIDDTAKDAKTKKINDIKNSNDEIDAIVAKYTDTMTVEDYFEQRRLEKMDDVYKATEKRDARKVRQEKRKQAELKKIADKGLEDAKQRAADTERMEAARMGYANSIIDGLAQLNQQTKGSAAITKALYIGKATMNTSMGVTEALSTPATWPLVPWIIGTGALQVANIAAQKFAKGGIVQGDSRSGDNINIRANAGEMMLTDEQQSRLFKIASGEEKSGGMTFNFNVSKGVNTREIVTTMNELARDGYFSNAYHLKRALAA